MSLKGIELKGMDWIHVVQDWDKWQTYEDSNASSGGMKCR
jgi:hypothetical protein